MFMSHYATEVCKCPEKVDGGSGTGFIVDGNTLTVYLLGYDEIEMVYLFFYLYLLFFSLVLSFLLFSFSFFL